MVENGTNLKLIRFNAVPVDRFFESPTKIGDRTYPYLIKQSRWVAIFVENWININLFNVFVRVGF